MTVWISRYFPNYKVIYMLLTSLLIDIEYYNMVDFKNRQGINCGLFHFNKIEEGISLNGNTSF